MKMNKPQLIGNDRKDHESTEKTVLRPSGIDAVSKISWGTHFCMFYETKEDLIEMLVPYFREGLLANEFCMWITSPPLDSQEATAALCTELPNLNDRIARGQIEILDSKLWYTIGGSFDSTRVLQGWIEKLDSALKRGFEGLRLTGNTFWLEDTQWEGFRDYEEKINTMIGSLRMLALCTYSLMKCNATQIMDVIVNHEFALVKRAGRWEIIESAHHKQTELTLKESEEKYRTLYTSMNDMFVLHEIVQDQSGKAIDYRIIDCNPLFTQITGISRENAIGALSSVLYRTGEPPYLDIYARVALTGQPEHFETYFPPMEKHFSISVFSPRRGQFATVTSDITEHKHAEEVLRKSEAKLKTLFEQLPIGVSILDKDRNLTYTNPALEKILGISKSDLIAGKHNMRNYIMSNGTPMPMAEMATIRAFSNNDTIRNIETGIITESGETIWVSVSATPFPESGKGVLVATVDITERRRMTEIIQLRLRLLEFATTNTLDEFLQKTLDEVGLLSKSPVGFFHFVEADQNTLSLQAWSTRTVKEFCKAQGKGMHYSIDKAGVWVDCIHERKPVIHNDYPSVPNRKGLPSGHAPIIRELVVPIIKNDKIVAIMGVGNKLQEYTQQDLEIVSYVADIAWEIADRLRVDEKIKNLARFPEENPNPVLRIGSDGTIIYANEACAWLLETWKCSVGDQLPLIYRQTVLHAFTESFPKKMEMSENGRILDMVVAPFPESGYLNIYATDITDRRLAEKELENAQKLLLKQERLAAIGAVAGGVAHDLRNPMASIKNAIYFLKMALNDPGPNVSETLEMMDKDISSSARTIQDLLDFAKPKKPYRKDVKVVDVIETAIARIVVPDNIRISRDLDKEMEWSIDPDQIAMALSSLIQNAVQAMPDGGNVDIHCVQDEVAGDILLTISDNGGGIPPENIEKIFEPLFTTKATGTGLGLSLAKTFVEMHDGRIEVKSEHGKGSTFTVKIPSKKGKCFRAQSNN